MQSWVEPFHSPETCPFPWTELDVRLPIDVIERIAKDHGIIQLRPVDPNKRSLVIGCGNCPLEDSGGMPFIDEKEKKEYQEKHSHEKAITISPSLTHNPTIVAIFSKHRYAMFGDGQFDHIMIDGIRISDTEIGRQELERLAGKTGYITEDRGNGEVHPFNWISHYLPSATLYSNTAILLPPIFFELRPTT